MSFDFKKKMQGKAKNRIGLDIGSSSVKMIEISSGGDKQTLVALGLKNISSGVREPLIESVRTLADEIKVTTKEASVSVSGPSVIVRFVSMPRMRDDELRSAIKFEAEKYIPFPVSECIVDYQILRKNERENKLDTLLVAVKRDLILSKIALVEDCGFSVTVVDVDTFAVSNSFVKNFPSTEPNKAAAVLNIGAAFTNISIVREGVLQFARDIAVGVKESTSKTVTDTLIDEIRLSFSYYENQSGRGIDEIYISGGGSNLSGIEALFHEAFESKPHLWDPLQFLDKTKYNADTRLLNEMKGSFAVAAGLALR